MSAGFTAFGLANQRFTVNEWRQKHPTGSTKDTDDVPMADSNKMALRSSLDQRVMNRTQSTGETKFVTFRCSEVTDDGQITLQAVLDRNNIPLDPQTAKLLHLSVSDLMTCDGLHIEAPEVIELAQNERVLSIVFQALSPQMSEMEMMQQLISNAVSVPSLHHRSRQQQTEFIPIQFQPRCRDLEYELEFEDKTPPTNACLKSVKHRMDGPVLFRGILDDGTSLGVIGDSINHPIEIYSEILDDVTHNIICIIFENDLRDNVVIDVKNISFTDQTLKDE